MNITCWQSEAWARDMEAHANQQAEYATSLRELHLARLTIKELSHELAEKPHSEGPEVGPHDPSEPHTADEVRQPSCQK